MTTSVTGLGTTLTKLDENGGHVFTRPISASGELAIDPTGNIFVSAGGVIIYAGGRDGYVAVFNPPASGGEGGSSSDAAGGGEELP
ncbi:hypothetical protein WMF26_38600 [Sorangium sp. So ce185]|uniref:hypothetical protein n=1 Tax=Sorangium sp. So ce185 TaxID=3133287 RepID=UPI003F5FA0E8